MTDSASASRMLRDAATDPIFRANSSPLLILDRDLLMAAANPAYYAATMREPEELVGQYAFDVFPDNPDLGGRHRSVANVSASMLDVLRHGRRDRMPLQRFDVPAPRGQTGFVERVWVIANNPIVTDDRVVGVLHQVEDVTAFSRAYRTGEAVAPERSAAGPWLYRLAETLSAENRELRESFARHGDLERAAGVLISRFGCDADTAADLLRSISHDTGTTVHAIARSLLDEVDTAAR